MKVSREKVEDNRRAILAAAGRLFRARGLGEVSVSEVMKAAGLTHGAFYGYFASKDELIAATLAELTRAHAWPDAWGDCLADYLAPEHRDDCAQGCPIAALGGETARAAPGARDVLTQGVRRMIGKLSDKAPAGDGAGRRRLAAAATAAMVGAIVLARAVDDAELSDEILASTLALLVPEADAST